MSWALWLVAAIVFAVVEMLTTTLFVLPFAVGALAGLLASALDASAVVQFVVFLAVSLIAFGVVRPIAARHRRTPPQIRTNTAALIGQRAVALEPIDRDGGTIKLAGETWTARAYDEEASIAAGARVE